MLSISKFIVSCSISYWDLLKKSLLCGYPPKEGDREWKGGPKTGWIQGYFTNNSIGNGKIVQKIGLLASLYKVLALTLFAINLNIYLLIYLFIYLCILNMGLHLGHCLNYPCDFFCVYGGPTNDTFGIVWIRMMITIVFNGPPKNQSIKLSKASKVKRLNFMFTSYILIQQVCLSVRLSRSWNSYHF